MRSLLPAFLLCSATARAGFMQRWATAPGAMSAALLMALALLSGCCLFHTKPVAPVVNPTPVVDPTPIPVVEPPPPPKVEPEKKPRPIPEKPPRPARPRPVVSTTPHETRPPAPAPLILTREISRAAIRTLLNGEVQKPDGKVIGHAVNLITDTHGRPTEIVVNLQGFMGVGDHKVGFPWNVVRINTRPRTPAIMLTFTHGQPPEVNRPDFSAATPARLPMIDAFVERINGIHIGRVVDVLFDGHAVPQAVVLDINDNVLQKRRTIAADWRALRFVVRGNALRPVLDLSEAQINASPPYAGNLPAYAVSPALPPSPDTGTTQRRNPR